MRLRISVLALCIPAFSLSTLGCTTSVDEDAALTEQRAETALSYTYEPSSVYAEFGANEESNFLSASAGYDELESFENELFVCLNPNLETAWTSYAAPFEIPPEDPRIAAWETELLTKHGLKPKRYWGLLDGQLHLYRDGVKVSQTENERELRFRQLLPMVAAELNEAGRMLGYRVSISPTELMTNFLAEGGVLPMNNRGEQVSSGDREAIRKATDPDLKFHSFNELGVDFRPADVREYGALLPAGYTSRFPPESDLFWSLRERFEECGGDTGMFTEEEIRVAMNYQRMFVMWMPNEKNEYVLGVGNIDMHDALRLNGAVFLARKHAAFEYAKSRGVDLNKESTVTQFFWTTIFYNTGIANGKAIFKKYGLRYANERWTLEDSHAKYSSRPLFNAKWRTSTFEMLERAIANEIVSF